MTKLQLETNYNAVHGGSVELPDKKNWNDVTEIGVKWHLAYLTFKDGTRAEIEIINDPDYCQDCYMHPCSMKVFEEETDEKDHDETLLIELEDQGDGNNTIEDGGYVK